MIDQSITQVMSFLFWLNNKAHMFEMELFQLDLFLKIDCLAFFYSIRKAILSYYKSYTGKVVIK